MILVTGCSRAGSKFTTKLLNELNIPVGFESLGEAGACSHYATGLYIGYRELFDSHNFKTKLHQVREPLANIESLTTIKYWDTGNRGSNMAQGPDLQFVSPLEVAPNIKDGNLILQCAKYWYLYNTTAASFCDWTYKGEDLLKKEHIFDEFCERIGIIDIPEYIDIPEEDVHSRKGKSYRPLMTWEKLESIDSELAENIKALANSWGYKYD